MSEIQPALTSEEWSKWQQQRAEQMASGPIWVMDHYEVSSVTPSAINGVVGVSVKYEGGGGGGSCHMRPGFFPKLIAALNDLLPNDDPRKITREDVSLLSVIAGGYAGDPYQGLSAAQRQQAIQDLHAELSRLAAKLAALLPPNDVNAQGLSEGA